MKINYNNDTKALTITTYKQYKYSDLFDALGDVDVVQASEVHPDSIAFEGDLYSMNTSSVKELMNGGTVTLSFDEAVIDCGYKNFIKWYSLSN
jgi:hypothetical protein